MSMNYCIGLGAVMTMLGLAGSSTGGHDHIWWVFGINLFHNTLRLSLGFLALAAVAAGPRHTRYFCLEAGVVLPLLALLGFQRVEAFMDIFIPTATDLWLYLLTGLTCLVLGVLSPAPLRLREAVERAPVKWA